MILGRMRSKLNRRLQGSVGHRVQKKLKKAPFGRLRIPSKPLRKRRSHPFDRMF